MLHTAVRLRFQCFAVAYCFCFDLYLTCSSPPRTQDSVFLQHWETGLYTSRQHQNIKVCTRQATEHQSIHSSSNRTSKYALVKHQNIKVCTRQAPEHQSMHSSSTRTSKYALVKHQNTRATYSYIRKDQTPGVEKQAYMNCGCSIIGDKMP